MANDEQAGSGNSTSAAQTPTAQVAEARWRFDPAGLLIVEGRHPLAVRWDAVPMPFAAAKVMLAQLLMFEASAGGVGVEQQTEQPGGRVRPRPLRRY